MFAIRSRRAAAVTSLLVVASVLSACDSTSSTKPLVPASILILNGSNQSVIVGSDLVDSLSVQIATNGGTPAAGVEVEWKVAVGDGTVSAPTSITNSNGVASIAFKAGTKTQLAQITAGVTGVDPAVFLVQQNAGAASSITMIDGEPQSSVIGQGVPLTVRVVDKYGNPVQGTFVYWSVNGGAGSFDLPSSVTDESGLAIINFTPAGSPGERTIEATTGGGLSADIEVAVLQSI